MDFEAKAMFLESATGKGDEYEDSLLDAVFSSNSTIRDVDQYDLPVHHFVYRGVLGVFAAITTFGNLVVIMSFWGDKQLTQSPFKTYTFSLSTSDLLVGVAIIPFRMVICFVPWPFGTSMCALWKIVECGQVSVSILILMALGVDRYRSVTSPLLYRSHNNRRRTIIVAVTSWLVGFAVWTPYILYKIFVDSESVRIKNNSCRITGFNTNSWEFVQVLAGCIIPIVATITLYAVVVRSVMRRRLSLGGVSRPDGSSTERGTSPNRITVVLSEELNAQSEKNRKRCITSSRDRVQNQNLNCYRNVILIVSTFLVCWLPFAVCWSLFILFRIETPSTVLDYLGVLVYASSAINPFIVMRTHPKIRSDISRVVDSCRNIVNLRLRRKL